MYRSMDVKHRLTKNSNPTYLESASSVDIPLDWSTVNLKVGDAAYDTVTNLAKAIVSPLSVNETQKNLPIAIALRKIESNMDTLDNVAGRTPQLTRLELFILLSTVVVSGMSPYFFSMPVVEVLVPSMAAVSASIGISAEYVGKVAVAQGKEISALSIQAAAEAEVILASAERTKSILPLCVGIATTASAFALTAPKLFAELSTITGLELSNELFIIFPLIAVLAAAIAGLATQESGELASRAKNLGNRRFASSTSVGRNWLSATEQIEMQTERTTAKWKSFAYGVLPGPIISAVIPGPLSFKAIVCAALAAAQAAYYLTIAEYVLADAMESVALKARTSAVADTYANQSARAGAVLPFTSALASLCAAASAASVELLPLVSAIELQSLISVVFPTGAALFAAAAAVSKARCEVDTAAASLAVTRAMYGDDKKPVNNDPLVVVLNQIKVSYETTCVSH